MKRFIFLPLVIVFGFCILVLHAQDQGQDKKDATQAGGAGKNVKAGKSAGTGAPSHRDVSGSAPGGGRTVNASQFTDAGSLGDSNTRESVRQTNRNQSSFSQSSALVVHGNQSNHYNGQWVAVDTHADWDVHAEHSWNHHRYRYYDGGWLIIDIDPAPDVYYGSGSTGSSVQASLAQQGYYHGPIDGLIGPGTRRAIAHYEVDNGLQVNGIIDGPLLASLRLD